MIQTAWVISGPRLVQTQAALNEAVYVILRIQGSEGFVLRSGRPEGVKEADNKKIEEYSFSFN